MNWVPYSSDLVRFAWEKIRKTGGFWTDFEAPDFRRFDEVFKESDLICDFGFGLGRVTDLVEGERALVHGVFWSSGVFRSADWVRGAVCLLGSRFHLRRVECIVPVGQRAINRYMREYLGFRFERKVFDWFVAPDKRLWDGNLYVLEGRN